MGSLDCSGTWNWIGPSPCRRPKGRDSTAKTFRSCHFLCGSRHKHNIVKSVRPETIKRDTAVRSLQAFIKVFYGRSVRKGERARDTENPFYPVIELRLLLLRCTRCTSHKSLRILKIVCGKGRFAG